MFSDSYPMRGGPADRAAKRRAGLLVAAALVAALLGFAGASPAAAQTGSVTFSGTVTVPDGASGADIVVTAYCSWCPGLAPHPAADEAGRPRGFGSGFVLAGEAEADSSGRWSITLEADYFERVEFAAWDRDANLATQTTSRYWDGNGEAVSGIDFDLEAGGRVSGQFDARGRDAHYAIAVEDTPQSGSFSPLLYLEVDPETGSFTSPPVRPGNYSLGFISNDGLRRSAAGIYSGTGEPALVTITAGHTTAADSTIEFPETGGRITGKTTDHTGAALPNTQITGTIVSRTHTHRWSATTWEPRSSSFSATTADDGTYTADNLTPGEWRISFTHPNDQSEHPTQHFTDTNTKTRAYTAIATGLSHSCALSTGGTIACWGQNWYGQTDAPDGAYTAIATGQNHSCALSTGGTIACWGNNEHGEADAPGGTYTAITAGNSFSCALSTGGTIACWGNNEHGEADAPGGTYTAITAGNSFSITAGNSHSCALSTGGTIACWGNNEHGEADAPGGTYTAIATGNSHSCALSTGGTIACWGNNRSGQTDAPGGTYTAIATGWSHSCALSTDGTIACWGYNRSGQTDAPDGTHTAIATGFERSCALSTDGTIACWGYNGDGQTDAPDGAYTAIATGTFHSCALSTDRTIACWGSNSYGRATPYFTWVPVCFGETTSGIDARFPPDALADIATPRCTGGAGPEDGGDASGGDGPVDGGDDDGSDGAGSVGESAAVRCFAAHQFGAEPVDVAKSADGQTVLAQLSWGHHDSIGCYLALDGAALQTLRAAPAPRGFPAADPGASQRCSAVHKFGAEPVDVAKSADGQTVLAQVRWGFHDSIGCYLALDPASTAALRAAQT